MTQEHERGTEREQHDRLQAEYRWEASPEGELKRALWAAREEINRACRAIADLYPTLCHGQWERQGMALSALVECVVSEVLAERGKARRLELQLAGLKGGE